MRSSNVQFDMDATEETDGQLQKNSPSSNSSGSSASTQSSKKKGSGGGINFMKKVSKFFDFMKDDGT